MDLILGNFLNRLIISTSQDSVAPSSQMTIYTKAIAWCLIFAAAFGPVSGQAWFFNAALAQEQSAITDIPNSLENSQTMGLLAARVAYTNDLMPDDGAFVEILNDGALDPNIGASGTLADVIDDSGNIPTSVYIVQPGDNVALVSKRFGISENTLRFANGMKKQMFSIEATSSLFFQ